jgi:NAD(P)-dependent dehydrogenase (short-subunit alcohol dehydrogenase family)
MTDTSYAAPHPRRVLVTGGSRGIGAAVCRAFAARGDRVAIHYGTSRSAADEVLASLTGTGHVVVAADLRDAEQVRAMVDDAAAALGGLDVLVNNAGVGKFGPVAEMSLDDWHAVIETNVNGVFYCTRQAIPRMKKHGAGYIFNVSSLAGRNAFPGAAAYCASKHAVNGFSEVLFQEVRQDGIRVTYLMPGSVATEFGRGAAAKQDWALTPADVGEMVVDLLHTSPRALHSRVEMRPARPPQKG